MASNENNSLAQDASAAEDAPGAEETTLHIHTHKVAVPEVRTGKVDVDGHFHKAQNEHNVEHEHHVSFDTVAVPEYHTGKCPPWDPDCEERKHHEKEDEGKHHGFFSGLARTLMNGSSDE